MPTLSVRCLGPRIVLALRPHGNSQVRRYSAPGDGSIPASKKKYVPRDGTYPKGFVAGTAHVGVKPSNTKFDDLVVIASAIPCTVAATITRNLYKAAPCLYTQSVIKQLNNGGSRGVVVNSGCANAVTGSGGLKDAEAMVHGVDDALKSAFPEFSAAAQGEEASKSGNEMPRSLVMSTGVIGQRLPIGKILAKIPEAVSSLGSTHEHWLKAARAICTTDTFPKLVSRQFTLESHPGAVFTLAGMTKGAGMIHPNMATLLGVICTDAPIHNEAISGLLRKAVDKSFNCISIDGDTSTNDTVALFANGAAATTSAVVGIDESSAFQKELEALATDLAQLVVRDGEGATKFVKIRVLNAPHPEIAQAVASSVSRSPLVKTALYGKDANWGRILCAVGNTPGLNDINPTETSVSFVSDLGVLELLKDGEPQVVDESIAAEFLEQGDLEILIDLKSKTGTSSGNFWTCDFSHEYVTINGDYRT